MGVRILFLLAALAAVIIGFALPARHDGGEVQAQSQIPTVDIG